MKYILSFLIIVLLQGCSIKNNVNTAYSFNKKEQRLNAELLSLPIDKKEANKLSKILISYSVKLAKEYKIIKPAIFHNGLVYLAIKKRGYCYHYAQDLLKEIKKYKFKSFDIYWAVHKQGLYWEHNALLISSKNSSFEEGLLLDAWRDEGDLYFAKLKDDKKYEWKEHILKSKYYTLEK